MTYQKGDVVWVNFPFTDGSTAKVRPALVISNEAVNQTGDYLLIQITSKVRNDRLSVEILATDYADESLAIRSYIRIHKIFILNESLIISRKCAITEDFRMNIIAAINKIIL